MCQEPSCHAKKREEDGERERQRSATGVKTVNDLWSTRGGVEVRKEEERERRSAASFGGTIKCLVNKLRLPFDNMHAAS